MFCVFGGGGMVGLVSEVVCDIMVVEFEGF